MLSFSSFIRLLCFSFALIILLSLFSAMIAILLHSLTDLNILCKQHVCDMYSYILTQSAYDALSCRCKNSIKQYIL